MSNEGFRQVALRVSTVELLREVALKLRGKGSSLTVNRATGEVTLDSAISALCAQWLGHKRRSRKAAERRKVL